MKKGILITTLLACLSLLNVNLVMAGDAKSADKPYEAEINVGGTLADDLDDKEDGAKGVSEYNSIYDKSSSVYLGGKLLYRSNSFDFDANGRFQDSDDQAYGANLSLNRIFIYKTKYNEFLHRTDHDYLRNLQAHIYRADSDGAAGKADPTVLPFACPDPNNTAFCNALPDTDSKTPGWQNARATLGAPNVYYTDHNPNANYETSYADWTNKFKLNLPNLPQLKLGFDHRYQRREGCAQSKTMSKCSGCHIESFSKSVDETTNEYSPYVDVQMGPLAVKYTYSYRQFEDDSESMHNTYSNLASAHVAPFTSNLQFDGSEGALPFSRTPDSIKSTHALKTRLDVTKNNIFTTGIVYSKTDNQSTDGSYNPLTGKYDTELQMDSVSVMAKWHTKLNKRLSFTVHGKYQDIDNDELFIDVNDNNYLPSLASGASKVPRSQYYGLEAGYWDWIRKSGYDSEIYSFGADIAYKATHSLHIKGGYDYHLEHRDNYEHHDVPEDTTKHTFKLSGDWHAKRNVKFGLGYKLMLANDAYAVTNAMSPPDGSFGSYACPSVSGTESFDRSYDPNIYSQRTKDRSNQPDLAHEFNLKLNLMPTNTFNTNFYAKYRIAENSEIEGGNWEQNLFNGGVNLVLTPSQKMTFTAGYNYFFDTYDSNYCVAIYDG